MPWRSLLFFIAMGAAWSSRARADFNSQEAILAGEPSAEPTPPTEPAPPAATPKARQAPLVVPHGRPPGYGDRLFHVELIAGVATTVGLLGVAGEINLGNPLAIGAGIGTNAYGTDWEAHARWRPVYQVNPAGSFFTALNLQAAFTSSLNSNTSSNLVPGFDCDTHDLQYCNDPPVVPQRVYWAQGEIGWEGMFRNGLTLRVASGVASELGSPTWQCQVSGQTVPCGSLPARMAYVLTVAFGYAF